MLKRSALLIAGLCLAGQIEATASDSFGSEASHFVGGAVMAGAITAIVDKFYPEYAENRFWIGFGISSAAIVIEQGYEAIKNGKPASQLLDAASHIGGSALGAYVTDKYILSPIVRTAPDGSKTVGVQVTHSF